MDNRYRYKELKDAEKIMLILGLSIFCISLLLGCRDYALGVALATFIAWLFYRWQITAVFNLEGLPPRKATNRLIVRTIIRFIAFLGILVLSSLGGVAFLFGVLTGLLLQMIAHVSQAFFHS